MPQGAPPPNPVPDSVKACFVRAGKARIAYLHGYGTQPQVTQSPGAIDDDATALRALELEAYRSSCAGLLTSVMKATGKRMGAAEALNYITECAKAAQAKCNALPRTDGFCKGLREGF